MTFCILGKVDGTRVLKQRHQTPCVCPTDSADSDSQNDGCLPCPDPHCLTCLRNHTTDSDPTTCPTCLFRARENLSSITILATRLDDEARNGRHARAVHNDIPGGDAVVLQSPAATAHGRDGQLAHRKLDGLDITHTLDESSTDPRPPLAVLLSWESMWRNRLNQPTDLAPTLDRVAAYLDEKLSFIARDESFNLLSRDLSSTVWKLEEVLHAGVRPERTRVPCWECGTRLIRVYCKQASDDHWTCPHCREIYDRGRFDLAKSNHLASQGAAQFVRVMDAVAAIGRPEQTVRAWMRRGKVKVERDPLSRRPVVWWPDVRAAHLKSLADKAAPNAPIPDGNV